MDFSLITQGLEAAALYLRFMAHIAYDAYILPSGGFSIASLTCAAVIASAFLYFRRPAKRRRALKPKVLMRAFFPRHMMQSRSTKADLLLMVLNVFFFGLISSAALLSHEAVSASAHDALTGMFGQLSPTSLPDAATALISTIAIYAAYEAGYYLDHYLSHRVPFLWEFHKVHHSAEVLTPITNARVHPMDTLVFFNIIAITMGTTTGLLTFAFGQPQNALLIYGTNAMFLFFYFVIGHLQHSQFWIAFTGIWGHLFLSPAHHQIHHSTNPAHFNKNFGNFSGILDWMFGTLYVPAKKREALTFGADFAGVDPNTISSTLLTPVIEAAGHFKPNIKPRQAAISAGAIPG
jgi:sterol desaturase/sphingolipid hydroxylase (fatty acid hydroxylase superfamily)